MYKYTKNIQRTYNNARFFYVLEGGIQNLRMGRYLLGNLTPKVVLLIL